MNSPREAISHEDIKTDQEEEMDWPQYFASGEDVDEEEFVPAYYRVEGPNGPVSYMNPNSGPYPTTMYSFAMEAQSGDFRCCKKEETPFEEVDTDGR